MDPLVPLLLFGSFALLLFLDFPIAAALGISSVLTIVAFDLAPLQLIPQQLFSATDSWTLLAVPFFILAGNLLAKTAISERLIHLARVVVGRLPAGLAMVSVVVSIFFAGISGSGPADTAALGAVLIPAMEKAGYEKRSAAALIAAGAVQDFDLTLRQYPQTYRQNVENASELGVFMRNFVNSIGAPEDVYLVPFPYWVDDRIMNIAAGFPINSQHYLFPDQIAGFVSSGRPTLFLLLAEDSESLEALKLKFPDGYYDTVASSFPNHDFIYFVVPGTPVAANP